MSLPREREFLGGEIAQRMNRTAGALQASHEGDVHLDRAAERFDPPRVEQPELFGELWKSLCPFRHCAREIRDDVGMHDPIHGQEAVHPRLVVERLAEEVAPIPEQQNVADVEDDDQELSSR